MGIDDFFFGTPEVRENVSTLRSGQEPTYKDLQNAARGTTKPGSKGAFGQAANYYRGNIGGTPEDYERFAAPEIRNFQEEIMPDIAEQYAGAGAGGLSSSSFRNAATQQASGLSERLASIRANLRSQAAQGLQGIGQSALGNFSQNMVTQQGSQGFLPQAIGQLPALATAYMTGGTSGNLGTQAPGGVSSQGNMNNPYAGQGGGVGSGGNFNNPYAGR